MAKNNKPETPVEEIDDISVEEPTEETPVEEPKTKTKLAVVKFLKHHMPYVKDDVAGIDKDEAKKLEKDGIVERIK